MSESNKGSRSLRPRAKLKRPEFYTSAGTSSDQPETSSSPSAKKRKESSETEEKQTNQLEETTQKQANQKGELHDKQKRRKKVNSKNWPGRDKRSATVGGCTSLQSNRRSSNSSRSLNRRSANQPTSSRMSSQQNESTSGGGSGGAGAPSGSSGPNDQNEQRDRREEDLRRLHEMFEQRGLPSNFFSSLAPRMQQILTSTMMPMPNSRSNQVIEQLQHQGIGALPGLTELCEMLCMGNEENLTGFNYRQAVPLLINLLQDTEIEVCQYSARALTYLLDSLPRSSHAVAEAIPALLSRVANIHDDALIMVAEQSLSCLEKLSQKHARQILAERGPDQVTTFLDFFSIVAQRHSLAIVVACTRSISCQNDFDQIKNTIPIIISRLKSSDKKSIEFAIQACAIITEKSCHRESKNQIDYIFQSGMVSSICDIVCDPNNVSTHYVTLSLKLLRQLALANREIAVSMLKTSLSTALSTILTFDLQSSPQREAQELIEAVKLVEALLPRTKKIVDPINSYNKYEISDSEDDDDEDDDEGTEEGEIISEEGKKDEKADEEMTQEEYLMYQPLIEQLYPLCWKLLTAAPNSSLRISVIQALLRMSYSSNPEVLNILLSGKDCHACSQIQQLLDSQDIKVIVRALQLTRAILTILPDFKNKFRREGLYHCLAKMTEIKFKSPAVQSAPGSLAATPTNRLEPPGSISEQRRSFQGRLKERKLELAKEQLAKEISKQKSSSHSKQLPTDQPPQEESNQTPTSSKKSSLPTPVPAGKVSVGHGEASSLSLGSSTSTLNSEQSTPVMSKEAPIRSRLRYDSTTLKEFMISWTRDESKSILSEFFVTDENEGESTVIERLRKCQTDLTSTSKETRREALNTICDVIMNHELSPFELLHTGVLNNLLQYILCNNELEFLEIFLKLPNKATTSEVVIPSSNEIFIKLIHKINQIISQVERYPLKLTDGSGSSSSRLQDLNQHQIKCNLQRDPSCPKTKNWTSGPVKIEPLAQVSAIERYLVLKGFGQPTTENNGSGAEDNISDTDDESMDGASPFTQGFTRGVRQVELSIKGKTLPPNISIYQAIREYDMDDDSDMDSDQEEYQQMVWSRTFTINYRIIPKESATSKKKDTDLPKAVSVSLSDIKPLTNDDPLWTMGDAKQAKRPLGKYLKSISLSDHNDETNNLSQMVSLLSCLFGLSRFWQTLYPGHLTCSPKPLCAPEEFENASITSKCWRQLQDPLCIISGNIPSWLTELPHKCPFLLPFDLRRFLFYISTFDRQRAIQKMLERMPEYENLHQSGSGRQIMARVAKEKEPVNREKLIKSAETIFENYKSSNAAIEVEYMNEVGTGLGPTLEFYTLISHELRRNDLVPGMGSLWRGIKNPEDNLKGRISGSNATIVPGEGLFPAPIAKNCKKTVTNDVLKKYKLLGRCLARALKDSRMLDLPISNLMARALLNEEEYFQFNDLQSLDSQLHRSLQQLKSFIHTNQTDSVEELYLDFNLPGYQNIELLKNGKNKPVNGDNLGQYIDLVAHWSMVEGTRRQFEALRCGFNELFNISKLQCFLPWEMPRLFCGSERQRWTIHELESSIRPDHGYSQSCRAVQFLFTTLSELNNSEQADFLRFVTGSPHLPVGGLKALNPPLTVVKKSVEEGENPENYLPSVMTCVNYLKLPDYSNLEVMREKLIQAITDGQGAFLLS